jgi:hypothetical protein
MNRRQCDKLKRELVAMRSRLGSIRSSELAAIASAVGRKKTNRGKEPTYCSPRTGWPPLSIPEHSGRTLKRGTAHNIINRLEVDLELIETELTPENDDASEAIADEGYGKDRQ